MANNFSFLKLSKFFLYLVPFTVLIVSRSTLFPFIVGKYFFFRVAVELALISFLWAWARGEFRTLINADKKSIYADKKSASISQKSLPIGQVGLPIGQVGLPAGRQEHQSALWRQPLVIALSVFTLIFLLAGFLGYNPSASFWSNFERGEGGLQMLHLFIFFILLSLLFRDEKSWRKMLVGFLWAAGLMIAYGLGAAMGISFFIGSNLCSRFAGSLGNPAYIGTYMIFALFFTAILANEGNEKYKKWLKWLLKILLVLFFITLLFSQTRGALLGLVAGVICGLVYFFFHLPKGRMKKIVLVAIIVFMIFGGLGLKFRRSIDLMPFCKTGGNRILDVSLTTQTFQTRLLLWKQALVMTKERPFLGWGPENFSPALERHYLPQFEVWYDRAHNVFFDYLAETGILGLLSYLGIFAVFYWQFFKFSLKRKINLIRSDGKDAENLKQNGKNQKAPILDYKFLIQNALIFALPIAYLVQGIVIFEVLVIYMAFFLFLAFMNYKFNNK